MEINKPQNEQEKIAPKEEPAAIQEEKTDSEEEPVVVDDRHRIVDQYKDLSELPDKSDAKTVTIPNGKYSKLIKLLTAIDDLDPDDFNSIYTKKDARAAGININSTGTTLKDDIYVSSLKEDYVNEVNYSDKTIGIKKVNIKKQDKLTGNRAVAAFTSTLGIGNITQVPLWHSGFYITIKPPKDDELINLEIALANNELKLGRDTNTLIYSNYSVVFNRIVVDFIIDHIIDTSVTIPDDIDIRELIKIQDLHPMILGLVASIYHDGYSITRTCKNTLVLDKDKKPICDYIVTGKVNPSKLLWVNRKALTQKHLEHISKRIPNSVTIDEVKEYQLSVLTLSKKVITIQGDNGKDISITIQAPNLSEYINNGELWVQNIITKGEEIFTDTDSAEVKNSKINKLLNAVILGIYNIFIVELESDLGKVDDRESIDNVLDAISGDEKIVEPYITAIKSYIDKAVISIVATPNYTCPKCAKRDDEHTGDQSEKTGVFKEFLPINMLEHFFDLSALKLEKVRDRDIY